MAGGFGRWESDPLFSAAEVVQDSADRMESAFRMLSHEQSLGQGDPSDSNLLSLMRYHRRDLATALETTKWQLEDFEGAVNFAALSDKSNSRENAISKHRQFIRAIRQQIFQVEKSVEDLSVVDFNRDSQWINSKEQDTDGLALFLSGGDSKDNHSHYDSGNSSMRRFLDSTTDSDEIVELKTEQVEPLLMNGLKDSHHGYDSSKENISWNAVSQYSKAPVFFQVPAGFKEHEESNSVSGAYDLELGDSRAKFYSYRNRVMNSVWGFLRNSWIANKSKGSFTKRRKDGEVADILTDGNQRMSSFAANLPPSEKCKYIWMLWAYTFRICRRLNLEGLTSSTGFYCWIEGIQRRIQRSRYVLLYNRIPIRSASAFLVILIILASGDTAQLPEKQIRAVGSNFMPSSMREQKRQLPS